jgi:hypothetical protein
MINRYLNPVASAFVFLTALITYVLCLEPSVSWWDCGEFISSAYRLEVGHPPGAPLFVLIGRVFTLFASGPEQVAWMINFLSALTSAFTVLFLYRSIVILVQKSTNPDSLTSLKESLPAIMAGVVGSLVYAFSDTFWFSAVEGEVYSMSSLFTAVVFWAVLRWDQEADEPGSLRWILLIAFLMGLSIGVHLLNLLAIPAIVLLWYYRNYQHSNWKGTLLALAVALGILAFIMYGLIPGVVLIASWFELFFVNLFRMPYHSGLVVFLILMASVLFLTIRESHRRNSVLWNTILLSVAFILIGYSSYTTLMVRSMANPPMDQNNPDNVFTLIGYLNREQYGNRPLIRGPLYNAPLTGQKPGKAIYDRVDGRYVIADRDFKPLYDKRFITFFPRMWNNDPSHARLYEDWGRIDGEPVEITTDGKTRTVNRPTFTENLRFFFSYQLGHMYFRYFMWNFAGRQNDSESQGGIRNGNWISGIGFLDEDRLGPQESLPDRDRNSKSRNVYFLLPLLLGLAGAIFHYKHSPKDFRVVLLLFIFTGIAIVIYLNQSPNQPRERDYSYAGSFYAFALWVGIGVKALTQSIPSFAGKARKTVGAIISLLLLAVPIQMAFQNWDDHDRSNRYIARDFAYNYLNSCAPDAILFTSGDNDTFPLWYAQEVEGIRTDVRVICWPYLAKDWYIDQMKRKAWLSDPVPFSLNRGQYGPGKRDYIPVIDQLSDTVDLGRLIDFVTNDSESSKVPLQGGGSMNYFPTRKIRLQVDRARVLANGTVPPEEEDLILPELVWEVKRSSLYKNDLMILDLIAQNNWDRPIYFTSIGHENILGLQSFFRDEGFAYRLVPIRQPETMGQIGSINTAILYDRLINTFRWGNINDPSVFIDYNTYRTSLILRLRQRFADLADALLAEGKKSEAAVVLDRIAEILPPDNFRNDLQTAGLAEMYFRIGQPEKGNVLLTGYLNDLKQEILYILSVQAKFSGLMIDEARRNVALIEEIRRLADAYDQTVMVNETDKIINELGIRQK